MKTLNSSKDGLTLVEVIIAMTVFGIAATGISSATLLTSKIAQSNIYRNTAYTVAQGYAEQIKSIQYNTIASALNNPAENNIPTKGLSVNSGETIKFDDPLTFGQQIDKVIVIDIQELDDGSYEQKTMPMRVTTNARNLASEAEQINAIEISLEFEWSTSAPIETNTQHGSIRIVKTDVTEY